MTVRRLAVVTSIISGMSWLAWELSRLGWDDGASSGCSTYADYYNDAAFALANTAAAVALASLFVLLRGAPRWIALAAAIGAAATGVGNSVEHCVAEPFFLLYVAGALTYALASCVLAIGLLVSGQLGRWPGLLLAAATLGLMVLGYERGGAAVVGVAWLAFGGFLAFAQGGESMTAGGDAVGHRSS